MNGSPTLRWAVIIVLSAATAGMVAVSIRANYLFGYGFGQSPEKAQIFGWANVSADVWKVSGLILIGNLWQFGHKSLAAMLFPIWVLCLFWGMLGAIGVYAQDRSALVGARNNLATALYRNRIMGGAGRKKWRKAATCCVAEYLFCDTIIARCQDLPLKVAAGLTSCISVFLFL